jgi:hypothetical protein
MPAMTSAARTAIYRTCMAACWVVALGGCASPPPAQSPPLAPAPAAAPAAPAAPVEPAAPRPAAMRYQCDHDVNFTVEYGEDSATVDVSGHGHEVLPRDAGGVTPRQTVYSSEHMRAEFGLGADGKEAVLRYAEPPLVLRCARE